MSRKVCTSVANVKPARAAGYTINCNGLHARVRASHGAMLDLLRMYGVKPARGAK